jgi:glutathione S-transferase
MATNPLRLVGAPGSPYTRKMRSLIRFRRIPFHYVQQNSKDAQNLPPVPVALIPILVIPGEGGADDTAMIDSTFQIRRLEQLQPGRSVIPPDPALAFLDALLEDYGDEWLTKAMFHYRWAYDADIEKAGRVLPLWSGVNAPDEMYQKLSKMFVARQVGRLGVVGSNPETAELIEDSYKRFLRCFDAHLHNEPFAMGRRPGASDFGMFGQLTQLVNFDPTPAAVALELSARVLAWMDVTEDLSGLEVADEDWTDADALPDSLRDLFCEVGRVYTPFLLGNADALARGADQVECKIDGHRWVQKPFPYQGKCLGWIREHFAGLSQPDQARVDAVLAGTGCEPLLRA